jgi:hypothetical protein
MRKPPAKRACRGRVSETRETSALHLSHHLPTFIFISQIVPTLNLALSYEDTTHCEQEAAFILIS